MTTTQQILQRYSSLTKYEILEIKRRSALYTYETNWYDVSKYLLGKNNIKTNKGFDFEISELGISQHSSIKLAINNKDGDWFGIDDPYTIFYGYYSRNNTKVRYKCGYLDENGDQIDETIFEGFLNEQTINMDYNSGEMNFEVLSYSSLFNTLLINAGDLSGQTTIKEIIAVIMNYSEITPYITYSAGNINPAFNISFDNVTIFENRTIMDVLNDMMKKSNSVWYLDSSNNFIVRNKVMSASSSVFDFLKSFKQSRDVNVVDIEFFDEGYNNIINVVKYTNSNSIIINKAATDNLQKYGENILELSGDDLTNLTTINSLSNALIEFSNEPKKRAIINTIYMPNIINFYDKITLEAESEIIISSDKNLLIFNTDTYFNSDYYFGYYQNRLNLTKTNFKYVKQNHDLSNFITKHYLIEG